MGQTLTNSLIATQDIRRDDDRCKPLMQLYLSCVEQKTHGLSDGDDCSPEATAYKACRVEESKKSIKDCYQ